MLIDVVEHTNRNSYILVLGMGGIVQVSQKIPTIPFNTKQAKSVSKVFWRSWVLIHWAEKHGGIQAGRQYRQPKPHG